MIFSLQERRECQMPASLNDVFFGEGLEAKHAAHPEGGLWLIAHAAVLRTNKYEFRWRGATQKHSIYALEGSQKGPWRLAGLFPCCKAESSKQTESIPDLSAHV